MVPTFVSDLKDCHKLIDSVIFRVGHRNLPKPNVDGLSLLNYKDLGQQIGRSLINTLDHAELSIYYGSEGTGESADITKSIVHCKPCFHFGLLALVWDELLITGFAVTHATTFKVEASNISVVIQEVECLGYSHDQQVSRLEKADVAFHMLSLEGQIPSTMVQDTKY